VSEAGFISYQLHIELSQPCSITIGKLGEFNFPAGYYIYTGSARRHIEARIARHLKREKKHRWHIDYLLANRYAAVVDVHRSFECECVLNQKVDGIIPAAGFGASDCSAGCGSHLKLCRPG